jgi:catechol 2,3-dioxygenase
MTDQSKKKSAEPVFDVAQLAAIELFSPKMDESISFFTNLLGMKEVGRNGRSVYLRGYEDPYRYSLKITEHSQAGMGTCTFRTSSEQALQRRATVLKDSGLGVGWRGGDLGKGDTYRFKSPDGHDMELVWDVEYAQVAPEDKSPLLNRPSKRPAQGIPVRRLDHVNLLCSNVTKNKDAFLDLLGFRLSENIVAGDGSEIAAWTRVTSLAHDVAFMLDATGSRGRLHHVCYWYGYPQHLMDVADLFAENNITVEAGPGKHGISQANFLYCIEPGGNRVELFGDAGYLIFDPAWKPITWTEAELARGIIWIGSSLPAEFFRYGTPIVQESVGSVAAE